MDKNNVTNILITCSFQGSLNSCGIYCLGNFRKCILESRLWQVILRFQ